jgi:hypothetical protein
MPPAALIIAQIALFAWLLQAADPLLPGPVPSDQSRNPAIEQSELPPPAPTSIYNDRGQRLGYTVPRSDGSIDIFRADGSRLGYSSGGQLVITPHRH